MQWLLLVFGIIGVCGANYMKLSAGLLSGDLAGLWYSYRVW